MAGEANPCGRGRKSFGCDPCAVRDAACASWGDWREIFEIPLVEFLELIEPLEMVCCSPPTTRAGATSGRRPIGPDASVRSPVAGTTDISMLRASRFLRAAVGAPTSLPLGRA